MKLGIRADQHLEAKKNCLTLSESNRGRPVRSQADKHEASQNFSADACQEDYGKGRCGLREILHRKKWFQQGITMHPVMG
jgi:hypothetical protein